MSGETYDAIGPIPTDRLRSEDFDSALARALELGREAETTYLNGEGQSVRWRLVEILTLGHAGWGLAGRCRGVCGATGFFGCRKPISMPNSLLRLPSLNRLACDGAASRDFPSGPLLIAYGQDSSGLPAREQQSQVEAEQLHRQCGIHQGSSYALIPIFVPGSTAFWRCDT